MVWLVKKKKSRLPSSRRYFRGFVGPSGRLKACWGTIEQALKESPMSYEGANDIVLTIGRDLVRAVEVMP